MRKVSEIFAENVKQILQTRNLPARHLATKAKITPATLSNYLSGNMEPSLTAVEAIAKALHVEVPNLLADPIRGLIPTKPSPEEALKVLDELVRMPTTALPIAELKEIVQDVLSDEGGEAFAQVWRKVELSLRKKKKG